MNQPVLRADPGEIERALAAFAPKCLELRAPKAGREGTLSGYFTDLSCIATAARQIDGKAPGVYVTLNPVNPSLLARAENRIKARAEQTTSDQDIECRTHLLFDIDAKRPAGISSNDEEHEAALARARDIRQVLRSEGWPDPLYADSGNGAHLVYRIDLPNDSASTELVKGVLAAAAGRFDKDRIQVDQSVFNAARISKLYGTVARKGDSTIERPHRLTRIIEAPNELVTVRSELLERLASYVSKSTGKPEPSGAAHGLGSFDIESWLGQYGLTFKPEPYQGGSKYVLAACPFNPDHRGKDAAVFRYPSGALGFKCFHDSCVGNDWKALRALCEPVRASRNSVPVTVAAGTAGKPLKTATGMDVYHSEFAEPEPIIEGLLFAGLTTFTARPKTGKSWLAMQIALAVANDTLLAGKFKVRKPGRVLYIALEENQRRTAPRLRKLTGPTDFLEDIAFVYEIDSLAGGGVAQIDAYLNERECSLVVIDTYFAFARQADRKSVDILQNDYNSVNILRELAQKHNCAILLVHHSRKAGGESVDTVLGTTGFTAACDAIWNLKRQGGEGDSLLTVTGREMEEAIYGMRLEQGDPFGWKVMGQGADVELSKQRREIVELLRVEGSHTPKGIADLLKKNQVTVRRHLQRLVQDGVVFKVEEVYNLVERMNA